MPARQRWVSYIIRQSGAIYNLKQRLLVAHRLEALHLVVRIFFREILLGLASVPAYFFLSSPELPRASQQSYRLRRAVTLVVFIPLVCLWSARIAVLAVGVIRGDIVMFSAGPRPLASQSWWQTILQTSAIERRDTPTIRPRTATSTAPLSGTSRAGSTVIIAVRQGVDIERVQLVKATSGSNGAWELNPKTLTNITPGTYAVTALAYDEKTHTRSLLSPSVELTISETTWQKLARFTEYGFYITIALLLILGVVLALL